MAGNGIFLSYRREDGRYVDGVRNAVRAAGYVDIDATLAAIRSAAFFIGCISANGYVASELEAAIEEVRSGARDASWLMVVRLGECPIPHLPVTGFTTLPEFVVRIGDLEGRLGKLATTRLNLRTKANDVMAPEAEVFALKADEDAIAGQTIKAETEVRNVVGDNVAVVGSVLTKKGTRNP
ncbi:MAG TPA: toll/interleukin-1 receptor domain-containing protein [Thermoanaerobaculia bacterium]